MFLESLETGLGLDIVLALQDMQNPVLDLLAQVLNFMGLAPFFLIVLPFIYWSVDRRLGTRLLLALLAGGITNTILKEIFNTPRPFMVSDEVFQLFEAGGNGLPSGHVMVAVVLWGYPAHRFQQRWISLTFAVYVLLMAWARMYGGVHYPQDVVMGVVFGGMVLALYIWLIDYFPAFWMRLDTQTRFALVFLIVLTLTMFMIPDDEGEVLIGLIGGVGMGAIIKDRNGFRFQTPETMSRQVLSFGVGIVMLIALYVGLSVLFDALADDGTTAASLLRTVRYFILGLFGFFLYPLLAVRLNLLSLDDQQQTSTET